MDQTPDNEWVSLTGRDLTRGGDAVLTGDLITYTVIDDPERPPRFIATIDVSRIDYSISQPQILGRWEFVGGTPGEKHYFGFYVSPIDRIERLRGGAAWILQGENVEPVREAIRNLHRGTGDFGRLRDAVRAARFAVPAPAYDPSAALDETRAQSERFEDHVLPLRLSRLISGEQYAELAALARHTTEPDTDGGWAVWSGRTKH